MIVRPSPHKRKAALNPAAQWPPKSPFQALLSSPGGRQRWQQAQDSLRERSPSPSSRRAHNGGGPAEQDLEGSDDDEESLRLKLEILETKKRLRDTQKKQKRHDTTVEVGSMRSHKPLDLEHTQDSPFKRRRLDALSFERHNVDVPVSPVKKVLERPSGPVSPARVRLGLQGSVRAQDISLKRPLLPDMSNGKKSVKSQPTAVAPQPAPPTISSFSQRLADLKQSDSKKLARSDRLDALRHSTFAAKQQRPPQTYESHASSQSQVCSQSASPRLRSPIRQGPLAEMRANLEAAKPKKPRKDSKDQARYDPFSQLHLESRAMSHVDAAQQLAGSEIYPLSRLLKEVKAPAYETPDCETDFVVFGIIAEKSAPYKQQSKHLIHDKDDKDEDAVSMKAPKAKFMVLRLCDLKWTLDCYLFGTAFDKYWKLTEGTLIAILNPGIMPPRGNIYNGNFSLKLASSDDCILEIGKARDIGTCSAIRKDNKACTSWTNKAKSALCDFHLELQVKRARKGRMEVNSMWRGEAEAEQPKKPPVKYDPRHFHYEHGEYWTPGVKGPSAASLLDDDDTHVFNNMTKEEASRKRIAASQRERDLATKLGAMKGGVAGEYFRAAYDLPHDDRAEFPDEVNFIKPTAAELGLLGKKADNQRLSPAKDRKRHFGIGAISSAGTEAMGWGGARNARLLQPASNRLGSPERGQTAMSAKGALRGPSRERSLSPSKKARFNLASGIKTPGRESGGQDVLERVRRRAMIDDHDDDDLDIV